MAQPAVIGLIVFLSAAILTAGDSPTLNLPLDKWHEARAPHVTVVSDGNVRTAVGIADRVERLRAAFSQLWPGARLHDGRPLAVYAVKGGSRLRDLLPEFWRHSSRSRAAGLLLVGLDRYYMLVRHDVAGDNPFAVVDHEYTHLLLDRNVTGAPLWLDEGFAELIANGNVAAGTFGRPNEAHLELLRNGGLLPWPSVLMAQRTSPAYVDRSTAPAFYAQSWALTHYLKLGNGGTRAAKLTEYLELIDKECAPLEAAVRAFGDLDVLARQLAGYVRVGPMPLARIERQRDPVRHEITARKLSRDEAALALGDLLAHTDHPRESRALLESAARDGGATPLERLGLLALRNGDVTGGLRFADLAIERDPSRVVAHYVRAVALLSHAGLVTAATAASAELSLRQAITLQPAFAPAYAALGGLLASRNGDKREALDLVRRAVAIEPMAFSHRVTLGHVLMILGGRDEARLIAERAVGMARSTEERETADRLLRQALESSRVPSRVP